MESTRPLSSLLPKYNIIKSIPIYFFLPLFFFGLLCLRINLVLYRPTFINSLSILFARSSATLARFSATCLLSASTCAISAEICEAAIGTYEPGSKKLTRTTKESGYIVMIYNARYTREPEEVIITISLQKIEGEIKIVGSWFNSPKLRVE